MSAFTLAVSWRNLTLSLPLKHYTYYAFLAAVFCNCGEPPPLSAPPPPQPTCAPCPLNSIRPDHTATALPSGKVLVSGGWGPVVVHHEEIYDPTLKRMIETGRLNVPREKHTANLLKTGKVLVTGGAQPNFTLTNTTELYDPDTGLWEAAAPMSSVRLRHSATLLQSGKLLVVGRGNSGWPSKYVELYDPLTDTWTAVSSTTLPRILYTATLLPSGKVLVAGDDNLASAELYDPATGVWTATGSMTVPRVEHTATLLPSGKVLVVGGRERLARDPVYSSAELYDPSTETWTATGSMAISRTEHTATLLPSGLVLVTGGYAQTSGPSRLKSAEIYDPRSGLWQPARDMLWDRTGHTATLLPSGAVLLVDGGAAEEYTP